jgi:hypothetical protein
MRMNKTVYLVSVPLFFLAFTACKPPHHPAHPNYGIVKPKVKYTPNKKNLEKMVKELQGSPYVWAEEGPNQFDCSGYMYYMYGSMGIEIPRVAREQAKKGTLIHTDELRYGDLIFFDTERKRRGRITHVGMYLGNGWFTHASTTDYEIVYSNLNTSRYYKKRLRVCRRYLPQKDLQEAIKKPPQQKLDPWKVEPQLKQNRELPTITERGNGDFYIQVGSFTGNPKSQLLEKIKNLGFDYKRIEFTHNGTQITKLLIGPYQKKQEAISHLKSVQKQIQKTAFIAEIR